MAKKVQAYVKLQIPAGTANPAPPVGPALGQSGVNIMEVCKLVKECATAKFKESVDMSVNLGVDAKKSDQNVRGSTVLPHGNGKSVRVAVFTQGAKAKEALDAGADAVGMQDLADKMKAGELNYQVVIASPDAMRVVGTLGQV